MRSGCRGTVPTCDPVAVWFSRWFDPNVLPRRARRTYDFISLVLLVVGLVVIFAVSTSWGSGLLFLSVVASVVELVHARATGQTTTT